MRGLRAVCLVGVFATLGCGDGGYENGAIPPFDAGEASLDASEAGEVDAPEDGSHSDAPDGDAADEYGAIESDSGADGGMAQGDAAESGSCASEEIVGGQQSPHAIAVDGQYVYWTDSVSGTVQRWSKSDGTLTALAVNRNAPLFLALEETHLYWGEGTTGQPGGVYRVSLSGGEPEILALVDVARVLALRGDDVVFTANGAPAPVSAVPKTGGAVDIIASAQAWGQGIAAREDVVYWAVRGESDEEGTILSRTSPVSPLTVIATGQQLPGGVVVDDQHIYWGSLSGVMRRKLSWGVPEKFAAGPVDFALSLDEGHVYYGLKIGTADLIGRSKAGGPECVFAGNAGAVTVANDEEYVYWARRDFGASVQGIWRVSKSCCP